MLSLLQPLCMVISFIPFLTALPISRRTITGPAITSYFPDPSIITVGDTYYAFGTSSTFNVPIATSQDGSTWTLTGTDAMPTWGAWSSGQNIWAPDVVQLSSGSFVLYYSANPVDTTAYHCFGAATSNSVEGPYIAEAEAIACPISQGGALDAAGFADYDGSQYIAYKIDGNSIGLGGDCGNTVAPIVPTPIMLQQVSPDDGFTLIGDPVQILVQGEADGPLVEAPSLVRVEDSSALNGWMYILFFSSNCYTGSEYDTSYAISTNGITNGGADYAKAASPLLATGDDGGALFSPGGLDIDVDGTHVVFHADEQPQEAAIMRYMWAGQVQIDAASGTVSI